MSHLFWQRIVACFSCALAISCGLSLPLAHAAPGDLLIVNARIFTGESDQVIENGSLHVKDGRIVEVSSASLTAPGATIIDAGGKTAMPGLINGHFHVFFDLENGLSFPVGDAETQAWMQGRLREQMAQHLAHGITSLLSPLDMWPFIAEARDEVRTGKWPGPRLFIAGGVLMTPGGHYICQALQGHRRQWCEASVASPIATPEQAREAVARYAEGKVDVIMYDGVTNSQGLDKPVVAAMVKEAHARGLRVLVHNADARDVPGMVEAGIDGFVHPPARTRDVDGSLSSGAGQRQLPVAITLAGAERAIARGVATEAQRENYETVRHNVVTLLEAGALPVFASDLPGLPAADVAPLASRALSGVGLSNAQVLQAATRNAAHGLLGRTDLGTLAPGKLADIILVDGNPIEDLGALSRVRLVIKDGVVVSDQRNGAPASASGS